MPIYEYRCSACGHHDEHLQKVTEAPLTKCPMCGAQAYQKQLSAAGFQLKGTGWYATDFKGGGRKPEAKTEGKSEGKTEAAAGASSESKPEAKAESKPEKSAAGSTS